MITHIVVLLLISAIGFYIYRNGKANITKNKRFLICSLFPVWVVQSFRADAVGWDTWSYVKGYGRLIEGTTYKSWEPLFRLCIRIFGRLHLNVHWFFAFCSFFILTGIYFFVLGNIEENQSAFWPVFFFMTLNQYFSTMNLLRQSMAMAIVINIYTVLNRGKTLKRFLICIGMILIAMQFHLSAIIGFVLLIPFLIPELSRKTIITAGIISVVGILGFTRIITLLLAVFPQYEHYLYSKYMDADLGLSGYYLMMIVLKVTVLLFIFALDPGRYSTDKCYKLAFIAVISIGISLMQVRTLLAVRVGYYFEIFSILLFPEFVRKLKNTNKIRTFAYMAFFIFGWVYFIYVQMAGSARGCVPYLFFWQTGQ